MGFLSVAKDPGTEIMQCTTTTYEVTTTPTIILTTQSATADTTWFNSVSVTLSLDVLDILVSTVDLNTDYLIDLPCEFKITYDEIVTEQFSNTGEPKTVTLSSFERDLPNCPDTFTQNTENCDDLLFYSEIYPNGTIVEEEGGIIIGEGRLRRLS